MAYDKAAIDRLSERRRFWVQHASLQELDDRHRMLTSMIGTDSEIWVEDEWHAIGAEIMYRTADAGSV